MNNKRFYIKVHRALVNIKSFLGRIHRLILQLCSVIIPVLLFLCFALAIYEFGFMPFEANSRNLNFWLTVLLDLLVLVVTVRLFLDFFVQRKAWTRIFVIGGWLLVLFLAFYVLPEKKLAPVDTTRYIFLKIFLYAGIVLGFIFEVSGLLQFIYRRQISPAALFTGSFVFIIIVGAFLLKLPNATNNYLSVEDALFTSTSAVCVTGLIVVDTATHFTVFGKLVILVLIQVGALGVMTFAGLFAYAVSGGASLKTQLAFKDVMSGREIGNIMRFVYRVILVTLFFEALGAAGIYLSIDEGIFDRKIDKLFFSVFHSVSAFCNAGFSTMTNGLYEPVLKHNYILQVSIALLIILGGMGFPIVFNLYRYLRVKFSNTVLVLKKSPKRIHFPKLISLNSRLALVVSIVLLLLGFLTYLAFEQNHTLRDHPTLIGKIATSFFGSVTPRTAGFNTVDVTALSLPMIMIYFLLMWIGASPGSTGGGIKTTTAGVAILNMISVIRGKDRTEFFMSEVSHQSIRRAFAVIFMSLLFIGLSIFFVSINDHEKGLIRIAFEVFSAFSTVGLSLGITAELSGFSKFVIVVTMFVGRVGTVTLMVVFIRQIKQLYYRYPREDITF